MANNVYGSGRKNVGSYQVAGKSYVTASTVSSGEELGLQLPNISNNITVKLDSAASSGTKATGSVTVAYPTASASPTYNAAGTLESNHHGDTFTLDGRTFTVNYEGTGSFGANEIKTYEQTGSALEFKIPGGTSQPLNKEIGIEHVGYNSILSASDAEGWSVSMWFKQDFNNPSGFGGTLFQYGQQTSGVTNEYSVWIAAKNTQGIAFYMKDSSALQITNIPDGAYGLGEWTHLVATFKAGTAGNVNTSGLDAYIDGSHVLISGSSRAHSDAANPSTTIRIGDALKFPDAGRRNLSGSIQNVCIWRGILNAADANKLYNSGSIKDPTDVGGYNANLVDWWRLDSGSTGFNQVGSTTPQETYISNNNRNLTPMNTSDFRTFNSCSQGVPFERHTTAEFYNAVTGAFNTGSIFGTFSVETPNLNNSIISITASNTGTGGNSKITHSANETFTAAVDTDGGGTGGGGGGSLRVHFRSTGSLPNVANNRHYWELSSANEKIEMNVKTKEIYLSANGGDCDFSLQADLTNIPTFSMYQHTGSGVDE